MPRISHRPGAARESSAFALTGLVFLVASGVVGGAGCGSDAAESESAPPPGTGSGPPRTTPEVPGQGPAKPPGIDGPVALRHRLAGWSAGYTGGFYRARGLVIAKQRLFSIPDAITESLGAITVTAMDDPGKPRVYSLPVVGKGLAGSVEAFTYEPTSDRVVMIVRAPKAEPAVVTLAIGDKEATLAVLTPAGVPPKSSSLIGPLYAAGAGTILAALGNRRATFTLSATAVTWAAEVDGGIFPGNNAGVLEDTAGGRLLTFGKAVYDSGTMKASIEPAIQQMSIAAPGSWTPMPFSGDAPPKGDGLVSTNFTALDTFGNRLLASVFYDSTCGATPCKVNGLWSFSLTAQSWTKVLNQWPDQAGYTGGVPFITEHSARRYLQVVDGGLVATSLDLTNNPTLASSPLIQDGDLGPSGGGSAAVLADGRLISADSGRFRVLDPAQSPPRWVRFGTATLPQQLRGGSTLSADTKTGEVLVFGPANSGGGQANELHVLSADGKTITKVTAASPPTVRTGAATLFANDTLYVAGGYTSQSDLTPRDDVWAFERASSTWKKIANLPIPVLVPNLSITPEGDLLLTGFLKSGNDYDNAPVLRIARATGVVTTLAAVPAKYTLWSTTRIHGCFTGYESGGLDHPMEQKIWRCSFQDGKIKWTSGLLSEHDFALRELRGATSADGTRAYFVGRHLWEVVGK